MSTAQSMMPIATSTGAAPPEISCPTAGTPRVNTTSKYCILPYGNSKMEECCGMYGDGQIHMKDNCYYWCALNDPKGESAKDKQQYLRRTVSEFKSCLRKGDDDDLFGILCSRILVSGTDDDDDGDDDNDEDDGDDATGASPNDPDDQDNYPKEPRESGKPGSGAARLGEGKMSLWGGMLTAAVAVNAVFAGM